MTAFFYFRFFLLTFSGVLLGYAFLFVVIVSVSREDEHYNFCIVNFIDQTMLLGDATTPLTSPITRKRLRMTCARTRMYTQFLYQCLCFHESLWLIFCQSNQVARSLFLEINSIGHNLDVLGMKSGSPLEAYCM